MRVDLTWLQDVAFTARSDSSSDTGYKVTIDGPPAIGGKNLGMRPMEMVLCGLGSCAGVDFISILKKMRIIPAQYSIQIDAQRSESEPKVFTQIHIIFSLSLNENDTKNADKLERAALLSIEKYCSVYAMLCSTAQITHEVNLK